MQKKVVQMNKLENNLFILLQIKSGLKCRLGMDCPEYIGLFCLELNIIANLVAYCCILLLIDPILIPRIFKLQSPFFPTITFP